MAMEYHPSTGWDLSSNSMRQFASTANSSSTDVLPPQKSARYEQDWDEEEAEEAEEAPEPRADGMDACFSDAWRPAAVDACACLKKNTMHQQYV